MAYGTFQHRWFERSCDWGLLEWSHTGIGLTAVGIWVDFRNATLKTIIVQCGEPASRLRLAALLRCSTLCTPAAPNKLGEAAAPIPKTSRYFRGDAYDVRRRKSRSARQVVAPIVHTDNRSRHRCWCCGGRFPQSTECGRGTAQHRPWRKRNQRDPEQSDEGFGLYCRRSGYGLWRMPHEVTESERPI